MSGAAKRPGPSRTDPTLVHVARADPTLAHVARADDALARIAVLPRPLVFTNGVFDILHRGHVACLEEARSLGASLAVAVNTDASVRRLGKGADRPVNTQEDRMAVLAALRCVDLVVPFDADTPLELILAVMPDVLVKGGDYDVKTTVGAAEVIAHGGRFVAIPFRFARSTSALLARIRR